MCCFEIFEVFFKKSASVRNQKITLLYSKTNCGAVVLKTPMHEILVFPIPAASPATQSFFQDHSGAALLAALICYPIFLLKIVRNLLMAAGNIMYALVYKHPFVDRRSAYTIFFG